MHDDELVVKDPTAADRSYVHAVTAELYVLIMAGIGTGVVVVGIGSRLAMLVLRLTSPGSVDGVTSDDGFTIGRITLSGTYNLLLIGVPPWRAGCGGVPVGAALAARAPLVPPPHARARGRCGGRFDARAR